jgi:hypothetical protein
MLLSARGVNPSEDIAREILGYFLLNPEAADSFEGIARWRLMEHFVRRSVTETKGGLMWLIERGYLQQEDVPGGNPVFLLNSQMREDAQRFVAESEGQTEQGSDQKIPRDRLNP